MDALRLVFACAALVTWLVTGCTDTRTDRQRPTRRADTGALPPPVTTVEKRELVPQAPVRDECFGADSSEVAAMQCAAGAVSRIADTLQVLLSTGRVVRFVDARFDDSVVTSFRYDGRIGGSGGGPGYHLLVVGGARGTSEELLNAQSGESVSLAARPTISPDGARILVSDMRALDDRSGRASIQIWRITADRPVNELDLHPFDAATERGWAPSHVEWRARDTVAFVRNAVPRDSALRARREWSTSRSVLVRKTGHWVLDPRH